MVEEAVEVLKEDSPDLWQVCSCLAQIAKHSVDLAEAGFRESSYQAFSFQGCKMLAWSKMHKHTIN